MNSHITKHQSGNYKIIKPNQQTNTNQSHPNQSSKNIIPSQSKQQKLVVLNKQKSRGPNQKMVYRRTKLESIKDRKFVCHCGKKYLSYPALYLHLKNKHQQKPQPESSKDQNLKKKKQGQNSQFQKVYFKFTENIAIFVHQLQGYQTVRYDNHLNDKKFQKRIISNYWLIDQEDSLLLDRFKNHLVKCSLEEIVKSFKTSQDGIFQVNINTILVAFMIQIAQFISLEYFSEISFFCECVRKCVNQMSGYQKQEYSELMNGQHILKIYSHLIQTTIPFYITYFNCQVFKLFGPTLRQQNNCVTFTQMFINWLDQNNFIKRLMPQAHNLNTKTSII